MLFLFRVTLTLVKKARWKNTKNDRKQNMKVNQLSRSSLELVLFIFISFLSQHRCNAF